MIKVKFDSYEVAEVSGDLKDVKKFVKSYMNDMDDEAFPPNWYCLEDAYDYDDEDEDDEFDTDACDEEEPEVSHKIPFRVVKDAVDAVCGNNKGNLEEAHEDDKVDTADEPECINRATAATIFDELFRKAVAESEAVFNEMLRRAAEPEKDENPKDVKEDESLDISKYSALTTDPDFKVRFRAEYHELRIRLTKLLQMLGKWEKGELNFTPKCSRALLTEQAKFMKRYMSILRIRAKIEGVDL